MITRPKKIQLKVLEDKEKEKIDKQIQEKVEKLRRYLFVASYHCEGACGPGCGAELAGACPPCATSTPN